MLVELGLVEHHLKAVSEVLVDGATVTEVAQRLTLDLPASMHTALKVRSAELEVPMADLLRVMIHQALNDSAFLRRIAARARESR